MLRLGVLKFGVHDVFRLGSGRTRKSRLGCGSCILVFVNTFHDSPT